jgi:hypothetical protein
MPETTRNSGVTLDASVAHWPPFLLIASSRIVGVPASIVEAHAQLRAVVAVPRHGERLVRNGGRQARQAL